MSEKHKYVYVDMEGMVREFDPETGEGEILEECRDAVLESASDTSELRGDSGVVRAYLGVDAHWHFDGVLTRIERRRLNLWHSPAERDAWKDQA